MSSMLVTAHGALALPAFLPDATRGVVRGLDAADLEACGVAALMVNALHLSDSPGGTLIEAQGGVHRFMGWSRPVASDSGGFQAFSLARGTGSARQGGKGRDAAITDEGLSYRLANRSRRTLLTPEKSIQQQMRLGADILFCLDQCTHPKASAQERRESVRRTIDWARRCREEFSRLAAADETQETSGPLLFAVVQGGGDRDLRRECTERLLEIGFDGYGFGGWPVDTVGALDEMVAYVVDLLPPAAPKHGLGIGKPETLVAAWRAGYRIFDCVVPTRDGRHGRLFRFTEDPGDSALKGKTFYREVGITNERFARHDRPVEEGCPCALCARYGASYLHHLFKVDDPAALRLATIHNLVFYARLLSALRAQE